MDQGDLVSGRQSLADLGHDAQYFFLRQTTSGGDIGFQGLPLQEFHHHVDQALFGIAEIDDADDIGMVELAEQPRLAKEAPDHFRCRLEFGQQNLDRDRTAQADLRNPVYRTHAARADLLFDPVGVLEHLTDQSIVQPGPQNQGGAVIRTHLPAFETLVADGTDSHGYLPDRWVFEIPILSLGPILIYDLLQVDI